MTAVDDASTRQEVRVISVYATRWRRRWKDADTRGQHLDLGRLDEFYSLFEEQLPRDLLRVRHEVPAVTFTSPKGGPSSSANVEALEVTRAELWLFALPSDQVVAAIDLDFESPPLAVDASRTIKVLEHGAYGQIEIGGKGLEAGQKQGRS